MRWDHTVCTWTARCTTTSPGGRSPTTLRLSPLTILLYILVGWHAGLPSWLSISLSGACVSSDSCSGYPGHPLRLLPTERPECSSLSYGRSDSSMWYRRSTVSLGSHRTGTVRRGTSHGSTGFPSSAEI